MKLRKLLIDTMTEVIWQSVYFGIPTRMVVMVLGFSFLFMVGGKEAWTRLF